MTYLAERVGVFDAVFENASEYRRFQRLRPVAVFAGPMALDMALEANRSGDVLPESLARRARGLPDGSFMRPVPNRAP